MTTTARVLLRALALFAVATLSALPASETIADHLGRHDDNRRAPVEVNRTGGNHYILCLHECSEAAKWVFTGSLNVARIYHTATLLQDGRVLIVGGRPDCCSGVLDSAELYDPVTGSWSLTGRLHQGRSDHTATLLQDGRVLVVGGAVRDGAGLATTNTAELYDPATGSWTVTGSVNIIRVGYTATLLQTGKVLVAGGYGSGRLSDPSEIFDPSTGTWAFIRGGLVEPRAGHTATLLADGRVLLAGGGIPVDINTDIALTSTELYDPTTEMWSRAGALNATSEAYNAALLADGRLLLLSDYAVAPYTPQIFDPVTRMWSETGQPKLDCWWCTATTLPDGKVLIAGGTGAADYLDSTELYTAATDTWTASASLNIGRWAHTATLLSDGTVLVAGGVGASGTLSSAELYQTAP